jgi:uncharacterized protein
MPVSGSPIVRTRGSHCGDSPESDILSAGSGGYPMKSMSAVVILVLAGCTSHTPPEKPVGMANPASVFCAEQGGKVEIRRGTDGETGYCHLPDGRVVEEWEFFRSQNKAGGT